ncbi:prolipoprotein diacylglyceryl transferase [Clostridia bacterium]|nr:prolipoprotein diacylglyceryl transferase [Clostridia bacterium]
MPEIWFPNLGIKINHLSREAFSVFGFSVYWYAILIMLGFAAALFLARREAKRIGHDPVLYEDFTLWILIVGIIGARAYYVIFSWDNYRNNPLEVFNIREGGLAIYGGIIAVFFASLVFVRLKKIELLPFLDVIAPCVAVAQAIGRLGNFVNREVFGGYTDGLFAMRYRAEQAAAIPPSVAEHMINENGVLYIQVQPTFLYESLWNVGLFALLTYFSRRKRFDGQILLMYFIGYGIGRFWIEGIRTDQLMLGGVPVSQALSAILAVLCGVIFIYKLKTEGSKCSKN